MNSNGRPLDGIRVLDLTSVLMGPFATVQLGDMGADVIKVESPDGDIVREIGPGRTPGMGGMFLHANRSKRSIVIDLKKSAGRASLFQLLKQADVLVVNIRPKALKKLGIDYEAVREVRPDIIFVSLVGYGERGPYAGRPAYDDLIQGAVGIPSLVAASSGGEPRYVPITIADRTVGLFAAQAVLGALFYRERSGEGQAIEIPMFETMTSFVLSDHLGGLSYRPALDGGGYPRLMSRFRRPYTTRDGYLCALIYTTKDWRNFFSAIGTPEAMNDSRYQSLSSRTQNIDSIYEEVERIFRLRTTSEWENLLEQADIPHTPMHSLTTIQDDPHLRAVGFFEEIYHPIEGPVLSMRVPSTWTRSQPKPARLAPALGEHTEEILREAGYSDQDIDRLLADGSVIQWRKDLTGSENQERGLV